MIKTFNVCDNLKCSRILGMIVGIPLMFWVRRGSGHDVTIRTKGVESLYYSLPEESIPAYLYNELELVAPVFPGNILDDIIINKYIPGDYLAKHRDSHIYTKSLILALENSDTQGLYYGDDSENFIADRTGQGVIIDDPMLWHEVKPVTKTRHVVIYNYL